MRFEEKASCFQCDDSWLYGILSAPKDVIISKGVLIIVGGPQYRIGSQRQFTLLARYLAAKGIAVMRFDVRGMGDSEGAQRTFEEINEDLRCAINQFLLEIPSLQEIVLWGLCDAASAALFYAHNDKRVTGLVLLNPWVRTNQGAAKTYLRHYYVKRIFDSELWKKILSGKFDYFQTFRSLYQFLSTIFAKEKQLSSAPHSQYSDENPSSYISLPERMLNGLNFFDGKVLLVTSGNDLTAKEFLDLVRSSKKWQEILGSPRIKQFNILNADHTFSRNQWRDQVFERTYDWIKSL